MKWLGEYAAAYGVEVACYCLMTSHIHLILIPSTQDGMQKLLKPLHMRYAGGGLQPGMAAAAPYLGGCPAVPRYF